MKQRAWFENFVSQLIRTDADFAYWPLVGWHENRRGNGRALLHWDSSGHRMGLYDGDDWRAAAWTRLIGAPGRTGRVAPVAHWSILSPDHGDFVASRRMRALPDWDSGARKAAWPDGQRLVGLSHTGNRGLCSDVSAGPLRDPAGGHLGVPEEGTLVHACGPEALLRAVQERCVGWPPGTLGVERFAPLPTASAGTSGEAFEVELSRSGLTLTVPAGRSVLETVEAAGIPVDFSCREGTCGTCETDVLDGRPDHRDSLLTEDERAAGDTMLICVSRSCGPRLVLDL
ncbi:flavin reductase family protein [Streptomyces turgidiscabies]|uniref:Ferredoxin n=1 Tax=Streptomyces turgidiscabies TaxID=85558 RepID=A0ABU0RV55_9ACTN|nr:2Fe-2S iron-sulfur cluster-binding protein [Streptomyces turgidiscabies]MDQ0935840.1 ferredoxin [Streptomyces turgidiscabies]